MPTKSLSKLWVACILNFLPLPVARERDGGRKWMAETSTADLSGTLLARYSAHIPHEYSSEHTEL